MGLFMSGATKLCGFYGSKLQICCSALKWCVPSFVVSMSHPNSHRGETQLWTELIEMSSHHQIKE